MTQFQTPNVGLQPSDSLALEMPRANDLKQMADLALAKGVITEHQFGLIAAVLYGPGRFTCAELGAAVGYKPAARKVVMPQLAQACEALFPLTGLDHERFAEFCRERASIWGKDGRIWYPYLLIGGFVLNQDNVHEFIRWW